VAPTDLSIIQEAAFDRLRLEGLPAGSRVLDAPCGAGHLARRLQQHGLETVGVDVSPEARDVLGSAFQEADLSEALPFADESFDCVGSTEGIEHLERPLGFLREAHRVLRRGGLLLLTTPNTVSLRSRVRFFGSGFFHQDPRPLREARRDPMHHVALQTLAELRYGVATSGFRIRAVGHTHIKPVSLLYTPFVPYIAVYTAVAFRKEKDPVQRAANRETLRALLSRSALYGENLLIVAAKKEP
jgi:SAM-dependent methyltransferase